MVQLNIFGCDAPFFNEKIAFFVKVKTNKQATSSRDMTSTREIDQEHVIRIKNSKHTQTIWRRRRP